jgi:hypothetical protein
LSIVADLTSFSGEPGKWQAESIPEGLIPDFVKACWRLRDKMLDFDRASRYKNRIHGANNQKLNKVTADRYGR